MSGTGGVESEREWIPCGVPSLHGDDADPIATLHLSETRGGGRARAPFSPGPALVRFAAVASRVAGAALRLALPPTCLACDRLVASDQALCAKCWSAMTFLAPPWCARLGLPFAYDLGEGALSPRAIAHPPVFDRLRAVAAYEGPARALVSRLKYHDRPTAARMMGRLMTLAGAELLKREEGVPPPLLVPVPLHRLRHWSRRYNQAALLAREVGARGGLEVAPALLERVRATKRQVGLDARARATNVRGAFAVSASGVLRIAARRVILVDDVFTTGATVQAATRALLRAGASGVDVLAFAHAGADAPIS